LKVDRSAMLGLVFTITIFVAPVLLNALKTAPSSSTAALDLLEEETARPGQELDLLEKSQKKDKKSEWHWKDATEESKTEWNIVSKRYVLADMTVFELSRHFGEAMPGAGSTDDQREALDKARLKLAKLQANLEKAVLDQNTSDATAGDMQKANKNNFLTAHEKKVLAAEHKREQYGFFAVEASGQDVLEKAKELMQALEAKAQGEQNKTQPSWSSIVAAPTTPKPTYMSMMNMTEVMPNATKSKNTTAKQRLKPTVEGLFAQFDTASQSLHADLGRFETMQSRAITE